MPLHEPLPEGRVTIRLENISTAWWVIEVVAGTGRKAKTIDEWRERFAPAVGAGRQQEE